MKKKTVSLLLLLALMFSCQDKELTEKTFPDRGNTGELRSAISPFLPHSNGSSKLLKKLQKKYEEENYQLNINGKSYDKIGCGYDITRSFSGPLPDIESKDNIVSAVLNMKNISASPDGFVTTNPLNNMLFELNTYSEFKKDVTEEIFSFSDSLSFNISTAKKFSFIASASAGFKKSMSRNLNINATNENQAVFAQASVLYNTKNVSVNIVPKDVFNTDNYIAPLFFAHYHLNSPREIEKNYGQFVLTDYKMGGKAIVSFGFNSRNNKFSQTLKENAFFMANVSVSGLFGAVNANADYSSSEAKKKFNETMSDYQNSSLKIGIVGGDLNAFKLPNFSVFTHSAISNNKLPEVDLNPWAKTVKSNDMLISINKNGLLPLHTLIREKNIARNIENYFLKGEDIEPNKQPITYKLYKKDNTVMLLLSTKYGDNFIIHKFWVPDPGYEWWNHFSKSNVNIPLSDDLDIEWTSKNDLPTKNLIDLSDIIDGDKVDVSFCKIKESRFKDEFSYLLIKNNKTRKRVAFSFYDEQGFFEYSLKKPNNFKEVNNINFYELYGL